MTNENIEKMLRELKCRIYKLNENTGIIEKDKTVGGSAFGVKEIVGITTHLNNNGIRYIIINESDIQIER